LSAKSVNQSWRLKIARAKKHLNELEGELGNYSNRHPYEAVRDRKSQKNPNIGRFRLRMTEDPDPMLAVIIGDVLFNLRSALDHLAVALAPRRRKSKAFFPIALIDPWKESGADPDSGDIPQNRRSFESAITGMPGEAVAFIKSIQPYNLPPDVADLHFLYVLSRLENADKHRQLILLSRGVQDVALVCSMGPRVDVGRAEPGIFEDGAILIDMDWQVRITSLSPTGWQIATAEALPTHAEMNVQVSGTATVAIKVIRDSRDEEIFEVPQALYDMLKEIEGKILPALEPFTRR
jgi:hypothetical protein